MITLHVPSQSRELTNLYTMSNKFHGEGNAESAKVHLDWQFFTSQRKEQCSRDNTWTNAAELGQEEWYKMYVRQ